jgi:hypothetical protein
MLEVELHSLPLAMARSVQLLEDFGLTPEDVGAYKPIGMSVLGLPYKDLVGAER